MQKKTAGFLVTALCAAVGVVGEKVEDLNRRSKTPDTYTGVYLMSDGRNDRAARYMWERLYQERFPGKPPPTREEDQSLALMLPGFGDVVSAQEDINFIEERIQKIIDDAKSESDDKIFDRLMATHAYLNHVSKQNALNKNAEVQEGLAAASLKLHMMMAYMLATKKYAREPGF